MTHRIFITGSGIADEAMRFLREHDCICETGDPRDTPEELAAKFRTFRPDGIIVRQGKITGDVQDASGRLKVISKHGVGTDNIDIAAATERGIPVTFTPLANYESVAEHTLAMMLALVRSIPTQDRRIREGIFEKKNYAGGELLGKTLGLIGFGKIGRRLCELAAPFQMKALVYHPSRTVEDLPPYLQKADDPEPVFEQADIISLHCPLTPETKGLISRDSIRRMKKGVFLINTARGGIINEQDLAEALENGQIGGAALDVFENEPPDRNHPLFQMDNVILTSHVAGASDRSLRNMGMGAAENIISVLKGESLDAACLVNKEVFEGG